MSAWTKSLLGRLIRFREAAGLTTSQVEEALVFGPGWITAIENGEVVPDVGTLLAIFHFLKISPADFFANLPSLPEGYKAERPVIAQADGDDLIINFRYAKYDAKYRLGGASLSDFDRVLRTLRNGLARLYGGEGQQGAVAENDAQQAIKADSVASAFLEAVRTWPEANPSDLWWFLVSRAYCDPFNHPASFARLNHEQSWKRTGGWALEKILVKHYGPFLRRHGIEIAIIPSEEKRRLADGLRLGARVEADKIDVVLRGGSAQFFGVVHVKASFAERRTDDVPLSEKLIEKSYFSPLWTLDCKSTPSEWPINRGELGPLRSAERDSRSAKRKDIEDDGLFSGCFSYNARTLPTPADHTGRSRIYVCDFADPDDAFSRAVIDAWQTFSAQP